MLYGFLSVIRGFFLLFHKRFRNYLLTPLLLACGLLIGLMFFSVYLVQSLLGYFSPQADSILASVLNIGSTGLGVLLGLFMVYLIFVPLLMLISIPFLDLLAESIFYAHKGMRLDSTSIWCKQYWLNLFYSNKISLKIISLQIIIKIALFLAMMIFPVLVILAFLCEFLINYLFVHQENFAMLFMKGKNPVRNSFELNRKITREKNVITGYRICAAILLTIPLINVIAIYANVAGATLIALERKLI